MKTRPPYEVTKDKELHELLHMVELLLNCKNVSNPRTPFGQIVIFGKSTESSFDSIIGFIEDGYEKYFFVFSYMLYAEYVTPTNIIITHKIRRIQPLSPLKIVKIN